MEPLNLTASQQVSITISDSTVDLADVWLDHEYMATEDAIDEAEPSLEEVRAALAKIPGTVS